MNGEVNLLTKNTRYRIIHMSGDYYLIDTEKTIWLLCFPVLLWLMPQKVYKIKAEISEELKAPTSHSGDSKGVVWFGAGGAAVLTPLLQPLLEQTIGLTVFVNLLLLMILTTIIISLRLYLRKSLHNKLYKMVDIEKLETRVIRIWPKYFTQYTNPLIIVLFFSVFVVGMFYFFLTTSDVIPLFVFFIMLSVILIMNVVFINPSFGKKNIYRVSIVHKYN